MKKVNCDTEDLIARDPCGCYCREGYNAGDAPYMIRCARHAAASDLLVALKQLAVRFPLEFRTTTHPPKCSCLQFEDNEYCRHLDALAAIAKAEGTK